jgi:tetratricopeptide (TPR) repeat protein
MANRESGKQTTYLLEKAEKKGLESFKTAKRLGALPVMRDISSCLMEIYQKQGRFQEALMYSQTFNSLNDSILNEAKVEALTFAEARWNVENKQKEINNLEKTQLLDHEIIVQKETEAKQHKFIIGIMVALFLLAIASTTFIALYIRKRRDVIHQKQLSNIAMLRMQNIRNVLSPHFIFNVLNNIWVIIDDRENARAQFDNLINLIRRSLINTEKLAIPVSDEIDFVKSFIELQKMGMENSLKVIWNIDDGIDLAQPIPGMILQIPVENAIKHGLAPKKENRLLLIEIKTESGFLQFNVADNGTGMQQAPTPTKGTGTGLKVLTNTMHILNQNNDEKMTYQIVNRNDEEETGTKVIIKIPLQYNYNLN